MASAATDTIVIATAVALAGTSIVTQSPYPVLASAVLIFGYFVAKNAGLVGASKRPVLSKDEYKLFPLSEKVVISHNTAIYRFALPRPDDVLGLPIGQHISLAAEIGGKEVVRSYTPTTSDDDKGHFDLLVKTYPNGNISRYLADLKIGQTMKVKGPKGQFKWTPNAVRALGMIAGGTGLTPMLQIIKAILKNPADKTEVDLIFANVKYEDILLKEDLDDLASKHSQFRVHYVLNEPPSEWTGGVGFVTKDMMKQWLPAPADDVKILICGPPPMVKAMAGYTEELGFPKSQAISKMTDVVFKF
ncbi:NADH-cytochrome b5 reductase [Rhizophlyctis rosea]|nr:NADH-cytochrome b5 reductase [Rhizophlyctis rosea]